MMAPAGTDASIRRRGRSRLLLAFAVASSVVIVSVGQLFMSGLYAQAQQPSLPPVVPVGDPLVVGVARTPGGPGEWITYARALEQVQRRVGRPIRVRYIADRAHVVGLITSGGVDLAFVPTYRYLQLAEAGAGSIVAAPVIAGREQETAVVVVSSGSEFMTLAELRGESVALADRHSLGGYSYVLWRLNQDGHDPAEYFSRVETGLSQDENLSRVAAGDVSATCVNRSALATWPDDTFRVIAESREYGMPPLVARPGLSSKVTDAVREALLALGPGHGVPEESSIDGFSRPIPDDYDFATLLSDYADTIDLEGARGEDAQ